MGSSSTWGYTVLMNDSPSAQFHYAFVSSLSYDVGEGEASGDHTRFDITLQSYKSMGRRAFQGTGEAASVVVVKKKMNKRLSSLPTSATPPHFISNLHKEGEFCPFEVGHWMSAQGRHDYFVLLFLTQDH